MRKGETEDRLDPNFVHLSKVLKARFRRSNYELVNFGKCIDYIQYGISSLANTEQRGVPIIRMGNLRGDEWDFSNLKHIELSEKDLNTYKLFDGDLLFNRTNSKELVGKCGVFREQGDWVFASYLIRVRVNENLLLPDFASFFLGSSVGRMQIDCLSRQIIGMTNINAEEIKLIKIPVPPIEIQKKIIEKFEAIYGAKRAKEAEAKHLRDGIDAYLLERLGIEKPIATEAKKTFFTRASSLSGNRFDPSFHDIKNQRWIEAFNKSDYPIKYLNEIAADIFQGVSQNLTEDDSVTLLKVKNLGFNNSIDFTNVEFVKDVPKRKILRTGDIITPFIGEAIRQIKFSVFPSVEKKYTVDNNTGVIRLRELALPEYVSAFLMTSGGKWQIERLIGGGVPFIGSNNARKLTIPLPPYEVQKEIVAHIQLIREAAKELEREARAEVEHAKAEVERIILGEVSADA